MLYSTYVVFVEDIDKKDVLFFIKAILKQMPLDTVHRADKKIGRTLIMQNIKHQIVIAITSFFTRKGTTNTEAARPARKRHFHPEKRKGSQGFRFQTARLVSLLMIISLLVTSNPAAPKDIAVTTNELINDVRFSYLADSGYWAKLNAYNPVFGLFFTLSGTGKRKQQQTTRIEVFPRTSVIKEGMEKVLSAAAYDANGDIVQGVQFTWESAGVRGTDPTVKTIENALFEGEPGVYRITARSEGITVTGTGVVIVREDAEYRAMKELSEEETDQSLVKAEIPARKKKRKQVRKEVADLMREIRANRGDPCKKLVADEGS